MKQKHVVLKDCSDAQKVSSLTDLAIFTFTVKCSNFHTFPVSPNSSCEVAGAVAHNASTHLQPLQTHKSTDHQAQQCNMPT